MVTSLLTAACVVAFALELVLGAGWGDADSALLLRLGAGYAPAIAAGELWRLVAAVFLHGGVLHLAVNLAALVLISSATERALGPARNALIFLLAGAAGVVASAAWDREAVSVGASGAIFGLFAPWLRLHWQAAAHLPTRRRRQGLIVVVALLALAAGWRVPGVDNLAHLAGFIAGLGLAGVAFRERAFWAGGALVALAVTLSAASFPAAWADDYRDRQRFAAHYAEFVRADRAVSEALRRLGREAQAGRIGEPEAVRILDAQILPPLRRLVTDWENARFASPASEAERRRWLRYASLRLAAVDALRRATATGEREAAQAFARHLAEAAAIAEAPK